MPHFSILNNAMALEASRFIIYPDVMMSRNATRMLCSMVNVSLTRLSIDARAWDAVSGIKFQSWSRCSWLLTNIQRRRIQFDKWSFVTSMLYIWNIIWPIYPYYGYQSTNLESRLVCGQLVFVETRPVVIRGSWINVSLSGLGNGIVDNLHERPRGKNGNWLEIVRTGWPLTWLVQHGVEDDATCE